MADGRAKNGGKRPNSGRKSKAEELGLSTLIDGRIPEEKRGKIIDNLYKFAIGSNPKAAVSAATLLLAYMYGKPTEKHEISNPDGTPLLAPVADALTKIYGSPNNSAR